MWRFRWYVFTSSIIHLSVISWSTVFRTHSSRLSSHMFFSMTWPHLYITTKPIRSVYNLFKHKFWWQFFLLFWSFIFGINTVIPDGQHISIGLLASLTFPNAILNVVFLGFSFFLQKFQMSSIADVVQILIWLISVITFLVWSWDRSHC